MSSDLAERGCSLTDAPSMTRVPISGDLAGLALSVTDVGPRRMTWRCNIPGIDSQVTDCKRQKQKAVTAYF